jgi:hypothetical protein
MSFLELPISRQTLHASFQAMLIRSWDFGDGFGSYSLALQKPRMLHSPALQRIRRLTPGLSRRFYAWTDNPFQVLRRFRSLT